MRWRYLVVLQQVVAGGGAIFVQRSQRHHPQLLGQPFPGDVLHRQHVHQPGKSVLVKRRGPALCSDTGEAVSVKTLSLKWQQGVKGYKRTVATDAWLHLLTAETTGLEALPGHQQVPDLGELGRRGETLRISNSLLTPCFYFEGLLCYLLALGEVQGGVSSCRSLAAADWL